MALLEQMRDGGEGAANALSASTASKAADQMPVDEDDRQAARGEPREELGIRIVVDGIDDEAADPSSTIRLTRPACCSRLEPLLPASML